MRTSETLMMLQILRAVMSSYVVSQPEIVAPKFVDGPQLAVKVEAGAYEGVWGGSRKNFWS